MTVPALYDACRANPDEDFLMLTKPGPAKLFVNPPANLRVTAIDTSAYRGARGMWRLAGEMLALGVDRMVDLHDVLRTKSLRAMLSMRGVKCTSIRKGRADKRRLTRSSHKHVMPLTPTIERYRDTFRRAGLQPGSGFSCIFPQAPDPALYGSVTAPRQPGERWIAVAPFAKHRGKIYPPSHMETVLSHLDKMPGVRIFLFAGRGEEEMQAAKWASMFTSITNLAGAGLGFAGEMALMHECEVMLSMDSANMHLASLAGTRVVSVWGATHPFCGFMGFGQKETDTVQLNISCRPCSVFGQKACRRGDYLCLKGISPQRVLKALALSLMLLLGAPLYAQTPITEPLIPSVGLLPQSSRQYLRNTPHGAGADMARMQIADCEYMRGDYAAAIQLYRKVNPHRLPLSIRGEYWYRLGICLASRGLIDEAREAAVTLRRQEGGEGNADFLEGYTYYRNRDFSQARKLLAKAPAALHPEALVAQIDLIEGNYPEAFRHASAELARPDKASTEMQAEMERTAGLAAFKQGDYGKAYGLLRAYAGRNGVLHGSDAMYALGILEQEKGNTEQAVSIMQGLTDLNDEISQGAYLALGQLSAGADDHRAGALAFEQAAKSNYDPRVGETAMYNYIVTSTYGVQAPFSSPTLLYEDYTDTYGAGEHADKLGRTFAYRYQAERNFEKALACMQRISDPDDEDLELTQRILYQLGCQEVAAGKYSAAERHLQQGAEMSGGSESTAAECLLWLGDALAAQGKYAAASAAYSAATPGLRGQNRALALYNDGYALLGQDMFAKASKKFRQALSSSPSLPAQLAADAALRIADCKFYSGDFKGALADYSQAAAEEGADADFATFRQAVSLGLTGDVSGKLGLLAGIPDKWPDSRWLPDVLLEHANTLIGLDRSKEAAPVFARLERLYPSSSQTRRGLLSMAVALNREGDHTAAADAYRKLISRWPTSEEAQTANADMRRLAASDGTLQEYAAFLRGIKGAPSLNEDEMEQLQFEAAEAAYADNISDVQRLEQYIADYPDGQWLSEALLDLAESASAASRPKAVMKHTERLLASRPDSPQALSALILQAETLEEHYPDRKDDILNAYRAIESKGGAEFAPEAYSGIMRNTVDAAERIKYARLVQGLGAESPDRMDEARLYEALGMTESRGSAPEGANILRQLASRPDTKAGAQAAVELGEYYLRTGQTAKALKALTEFTDRGATQSYWLARGFIALSDAYRKQGDATLADEYLRSLKDNYPGSETDIKTAISTRLRK